MMGARSPLTVVQMSLARLIRKFGLLLPGLALLALLSGWAGFRASEALGLAELQITGQSRLDLYAASLEREIEKYAYLPAALGLDREVIRLVTQGGDYQGHAVNLYLEQLNERVGTLSIYVLDRTGRVAATSNWNRPDSYLGEDLSFRPYFAAAASGGAGRFFGIGTTRSEPGYFLSSPLYENTQWVGVAVVKVSLEQLEQSWATAEAPALVSDENGVVILTSVPGWKFTALKPLDEGSSRRFHQTQQYNSRPLPPFSLSQERPLSATARLVRLTGDGKAGPAGWFLAQTAPLAMTGWQLTVLSPTRQINSMAWTRAALAAIACAFVVIVAVTANLRRRHLRERLAAREALQQAHDELERKVEERTQTLRAAQEELVHAGKLAVIGQLSAGLAHELNQPLAALRTLSGNAVKFLQRGDLEAAQGNLDRIGQLVDGMGTLTSQLKSFARKSSGAPRPVPVRRAVDNALFLLERRLRQSGLQVIQDLAGDDLTAACDANRLEQVLVNLIGNALDSMEGRPGGRLWLGGQRIGDRLCLSVRDNGPGLAEQVLPRLFEPFFTTKESGGGLGLGLAISAGIVRDFGGTLTASNHPDGGALFTLDLPAAKAGENPCPTP